MKTTLPPEKTVGNRAALMGNQGKERVKTLASSKERVTTRRVPRVGILVGCTKDLNGFRKAYLVLVNIM